MVTVPPWSLDPSAIFTQSCQRNRRTTWTQQPAFTDRWEKMSPWVDKHQSGFLFPPREVTFPQIFLSWHSAAKMYAAERKVQSCRDRRCQPNANQTTKSNDGHSIQQWSSTKSYLQQFSLVTLIYFKTICSNASAYWTQVYVASKWWTFVSYVCYISPKNEYAAKVERLLLNIMQT